MCKPAGCGWLALWPMQELTKVKLTGQSEAAEPRRLLRGADVGEFSAVELGKPSAV